MKKYIAILCILGFVVLIGYTYGAFEKSHATLIENKTITKEKDDFILHVQVNDSEEGVEVLHSIQYNGKEDVEIHHQTPLVSISLLDNKHDFTGSYVSKVIERGNIYHPQKATILSVPSMDVCDLFIKARFQVDGEMIAINHMEELKFK